jgi:2-furoyl-CoA dehydrogenase large subunit
MAAVAVRDKLARIASQTLNVAADEVAFADGRIFARDNPENSLRFHRVAGLAHWSPGSLPEGMTGGIRETASWDPPELTPPDAQDRINTSLAYGFVFDFCGVEIDPDTGTVRIDDYVTMHDSGKRLNPLIVDGQIHGAFGQGLGAALYESFEYDDDGNFLSGTFAEYLVPTSDEVPTPRIMHMESPSPFTPLGAKGVGEGNCMSTPVCVANAVCDALGIDHIDLPLTPAKLGAVIYGDEPAPPEGVAAPIKAAGLTVTGAGEAMVPAPPEEVWETLLDPKRLAAVIPGCHELVYRF